MLARVPVIAAMLLAAACGSDPVLRDCPKGANWEVWVAREAANKVLVVNGLGFKPAAQIELAPTQLTHPYAIAFSDDELGLLAVIGMRGSEEMQQRDGGVVIVDIVNTASPPLSQATMRNPRVAVSTREAITAVAIRPGTKEVWAIAPAQNRALVIDTVTATVTRSVEVAGVGPLENIVFGADGAKAFFVGEQGVGVVDAASGGTEGSWLAAGKSFGAGFSDAKTLWLATDSGVIGKIDVSAPMTPIAPFAMGIAGAHGLGVMRTQLLVSTLGEGKVELIDLGAKALELPLASGARPGPVTVPPNCAMGYVLDETEGALHEVEPSQRKLKGSMAIDGATHGLASRIEYDEM